MKKTALALILFLVIPLVIADYPNCPEDQTEGIWIINTSQTINESRECKVIVVESGNTLTLNNSYNNTFIQLTADNITVESGAAIDATGKGYAGGAAKGWGQGLGRGQGSLRAGGGAGYGGEGGEGYQIGYGTGGKPYGSSLTPDLLGSGGGGGYTGIGGDGGGAIILNVNNKLENNGTITADGTTGGAGGANGG
ncbi:hypothetical protein KY345_02685, partial [Candidatus Woesearchaeota archaeon]|nr:hypothetical protein [Candidatus Woesearchaeota archaeon]